MNDLIERSKAVDAIYWNVMEVNNKEMAESVLSDVPTIDAEPVRHGQWINNGFEPVRCSVCGITGDAINGIPWAIKSFKYCPHCGAKMDEEVNEDETN